MSELSIYTLNTWFPPYSRHRAARARAISQEILRLTPDVVCLQELFLSEPRQIVTSALAAAIPIDAILSLDGLAAGCSSHRACPSSTQPSSATGSAESLRTSNTGTTTPAKASV